MKDNKNHKDTIDEIDELINMEIKKLKKRSKMTLDPVVDIKDLNLLSKTVEGLHRCQLERPDPFIKPKNALTDEQMAALDDEGLREYIEWTKSIQNPNRKGADN